MSTMILVGDDAFQARYQARYPTYWEGDANIVAANVETYVQMAIDEGLPGAAPPISVLIIRPSGIEWRKGGPTSSESAS